ncbi:MAG: helix-turn-helix transcriptional regulator, partial [Deltaproteobacteria bacterium]|nr:helix-turn-helix transcriptional regulator [Deltaproteobacteria bacterium]
GEARYVLLDALRDGPKHGYEIIKTLEERSAGRYVSSPGTVYPTMQYLEELGLVRADREGERRVYHLTEAGRAELDAHAEHVDAFWARFAVGSTAQAIRHEVGFLEDELDDLARTAWRGLREAIEREDQQTIRQVRLAVERCQNEIREIITERGSGKLEQVTRGKK